MRVIIIGSGIGGSAIGALLSTEKGWEVELYEKNKLIGGRFASYERNGFRLDVGCHIIGNCDKGRLGRVLDIIGYSDRVKWSYTKDPGPVYYYKGERCKFPGQMDKLGLRPEDMGNILKLYQDFTSFSEDDLNGLNETDMASFLRRYTEDKKVTSIFGFLTGMYFVVPYDKAPVGDWIRCQQEIQRNRSSGYPVGGTVAVPSAYCDFIRGQGGVVETVKGVKKIVTDGGSSVGVELDDGSLREADMVISNVDCKTTVLSLVGKEHYPDDVVKRVSSYTFSNTTFLIKVALDKAVTSEKLIMYIGRDDLEELAHEVIETGTIPQEAPFLMIPVISNLDPTAAPPGKQLVFAGTGCPPTLDIQAEDWSRWTDACLAGLKKALPEIEGHIMWVESTSPLDIDRHLGEDGNVIGIAQIVGQVGGRRPPLKDPVIENLYHCSADTGLRGIGGELAADSALRLYDILVKDK